MPEMMFRRFKISSFVLEGNSGGVGGSTERLSMACGGSIERSVVAGTWFGSWTCCGTTNCAALDTSSSSSLPGDGAIDLAIDRVVTVIVGSGSLTGVGAIDRIGFDGDVVVIVDFDSFTRDGAIDRDVVVFVDFDSLEGDGAIDRVVVGIVDFDFPSKGDRQRVVGCVVVVIVGFDSLTGDGAIDRAVVVFGFDSLTGDGAIDLTTEVIAGLGFSF